MRLKCISGLLIALVCAAAAVPATGQVGSFSASPAAFSPDGDGVNEFSTLRYSVSDTLLELALVVFAADSVTPVDTVIAPAPTSRLGLQTATWDGRRWDGGPAPEGTYVATITWLSELAVAGTLSVPLFVDMTPPSVQITGVDPALYFPGIPGRESVLTVSFNLTGVSPVPPGRTPDEIQYRVITPSGAPLDPSNLDGRISFEPPLPFVDPYGVDSDGTYNLKWDAGGQGSLVDGFYRVVVFVVDAAGYTRVDTTMAEFDNKAPSISWIRPPSGEKVNVLPDTLYGYSWDRSGVDSLYVRYGTAGPFAPMTWTVRDDTAFFAVPVAGAITTEGDNKIQVRAKDSVGFTTGHIARQTWEVSWLVSSPTPPTLDPFDGVWHSDRYTVSGDVPPEAGLESTIRVYNNGALVDTVLTLLLTRFESTVPLAPGENIIVATLRDPAGNESLPSNAVRVVLDASTGLFVPTPFRVGNDFAVNLSLPATSVEIDIYDMTGDLVVELESNATAKSFAIPWDARNGNGVVVKKGPLVAVATVTYASGQVARIRRIFLVEPGS